MTTTSVVLPAGSTLALVDVWPGPRRGELFHLLLAASTGLKWMGRPLGPPRRVLHVTGEAKWAEHQALMHSTQHPEVYGNLLIADLPPAPVNFGELVDTLIRANTVQRFEIFGFSQFDPLKCASLANRLARETGAAVAVAAKITHCWVGVDEVIEIVEYGAVVRAREVRSNPIPAWLA